MSGALSFTITAVDQTTKTIDAINARVAAFGAKSTASINRIMAPVNAFKRLAGTFGDVSGLTRVGGAFRGIGRAANDAYNKIGQVVPLIGIIGSAASVAGITRMVTAWSEWGLRVGQTAQRIGMSAAQLAGFQGAAQLAGSSAEAMAGGMQALGQTMYDAIGGRNTQAIVMFRTLGIAFDDGTRHARAAADVLPEVADKIAAMRDPYAQAQVAATLFGGAAEGLLPILRLGSAGIRQYVADAQQYNYVTNDSIQAAGRLALAQRRVMLAVEGLRNRIAERLEPVLTPMLTHFADWLATSPAVAQGVDWLGQKVQELGQWIDAGGVQRFGETLHGWLEPIKNVVTALGGPQKAIEDLMILMATRFAIQVITPFLTLGTAVFSATTRVTALTAGMAAMQGGGLVGWLGKVTGLLGGLGLAAAAWEGINLAQTATQPAGDGYANLLHNMLFESNPFHWTQSYHPGAAPGNAAPGGKPGATTNSFDTTLPSEARGLLDTIAGTESPGYNVTYGGGKLPDYSNAPAPGHVITSGPNAGKISTAFGRYQFLNSTWDEAASALGLTDKTPQSQDRAAWWLAQRDYLKRTGHNLLADIRSGTPAALSMVGHALSPTWTSLPGGIEQGTTGNRFAMQMQANMDREAMAAPLPTPVAPAAQGAPLAIGGGQGAAGSNSTGSNSSVRLHLEGPDGYKARVISNPQGVDIGGPLVERPMLLGANP